jgi:hypothetical protein
MGREDSDDPRHPLPLRHHILRLVHRDGAAVTHTSFDDCEPLEQFTGPSGLKHLLAARQMIKVLERIASSGILPEADEAEIRQLICRACRAFEIPTLAERPANGNADMDAQIDAVAIEMARP